MDKEARDLAQTRIYSDEPGKEGWSSSDYKLHESYPNLDKKEGALLQEDNPDYYKNVFENRGLVKKPRFFGFGGKKKRKTKKRKLLSRKNKKNKKTKKTKTTKRSKTPKRSKNIKLKN